MMIFRRPGASDISEPHHPPPELRAAESFNPPLDALPATRAEVYAIFGNPGHRKPSKHWQRERMVVAKGLPGQWNNGKGRLYIHELAEPYLREALQRAADRRCLKIDRLGCYTHRHQRHDPARPLSYHSWGIAIDIDPAQNRARRFVDTAPKPFSSWWREWWPHGISEELVECFESVGWRWGGRWKHFVDPMHFELVR